MDVMYSYLVKIINNNVRIFTGYINHCILPPYI